nr:prenyltransferase/squalene oxidase repeat-containing protein [Pirellula staleyi]
MSESDSTRGGDSARTPQGGFGPSPPAPPSAPPYPPPPGYPAGAVPPAAPQFAGIPVASPPPGYGYPGAAPGYPQGYQQQPFPQAPQGFPQQYPPAGYPQQAYPQQAYPQQQYPPAGYPQPGYPPAQPQYQQPAYPQQPYYPQGQYAPQPGYPQQAYPQQPTQPQTAMPFPSTPMTIPQVSADGGGGAAPIPLSAFQSVAPLRPIPVTAKAATPGGAASATPAPAAPGATPSRPTPVRPTPVSGESGAAQPTPTKTKRPKPVKEGAATSAVTTSAVPSAGAVSPPAGAAVAAPSVPPTLPARPATPAAASSAAASPAAMQPLPSPMMTMPLRPQPVVARPVLLAPAGEITSAPKVDTELADEEGANDPAQKVVKSAPPWMVSMLVHMVAIVVLALLYIVTPPPNQVEIEIVYAEKLGEQVLDDTLQSPESLNMEIIDPALALDSKPVDDPFAAPPMVEMMELDAINATDDIVAPSIGMALTGREEGSKKALLAAYGGNATTEASVRLGLEWLKRNQQKDGSWSLTGPYADGGGVENKVSATAMALLAFQGAGHTHQMGDFKKEVISGWKALKAMQNADGFFECESANHHRLYAQAQATIAACEIYGMTKDPEFKATAQKALDFAHKAQAPEGGWRYEPRIDSDTSVTGWYMMALQSGRMAGLEVQSPSVDKITQFLDRVSHENGSRYSYKPGEGQTLTMTAEGLLCRQYLGWEHDDPRMRAGMDYVLANLIDYSDQNVYYWYYATQAAHHMDGDDWNRWNAVMREEIPRNQVKTGAERGSWSQSGDRWGPHGGRLYVTCLSIYMLEVYYRHLPIYKYRLK